LYARGCSCYGDVSHRKPLSDVIPELIENLCVNCMNKLDLSNMGIAKQAQPFILQKIDPWEEAWDMLKVLVDVP
jgi:hypothetical protein